jgi:hypothetical protein
MMRVLSILTLGGLAACTWAPFGGVSAADAGADGAVTPVADGGTTPWCEALGNKMDRCEAERECGARFSGWCARKTLTNSRAFEEADIQCLNECNGATIAECRYRKYNAQQLTPTQRNLIRDYCATCAAPGCEASLLTYDASKGSAAVSDAFVAVWELSDTVTEAIRTQCTGTALKVTNGNCPMTFGQCASGPYLDAQPDCKTP